MANPNSKRGQAIAIMAANPNEPMASVVAMIAKKIGVTEANAKSYYKWIVANGMASGNVEKTSKAKAAKPAKVSAKEATVKRLAAEVVAKAKKAETKKPAKATQAAAPVKSEKTDAELAEIKAKNLARLKDIASRTRNYTAGQIANPIIETDGSLGPIEYHESFAAPAFLNKSDLDVVL